MAVFSFFFCSRWKFIYRNGRFPGKQKNWGDLQKVGRSRIPNTSKLSEISISIYFFIGENLDLTDGHGPWFYTWIHGFKPGSGTRICRKFLLTVCTFFG